MSHHSHDNAHIKQVLTDVISISMSHIQDLALALKKLNITDSNMHEKSEVEKAKSANLNFMLHMLNDAIHPAHKLAIELFPEAKEFVDLCKENHKLAIDRKLIASTCHCYSCKIEKPV